MIIPEPFLWTWFALAALSTAYVAWDNFVAGNPEETVMKWGWVLITVYMGPIALALYVLTDKEPRPGEHESFIRPLWKQGIGSTVHCIAGDATGIVTAAVITAALGLPMWVDLIVEYVAGFGFGLLDLPGPVHEGHDGRLLPRGAARRLHARVAVDEHDGRRHVPRHDLADDGPGHAGHGAHRAPVLGGDVPRRDRRLLRRLPGQRLDGLQEPQARPDDRPPRHRGRAGRDTPLPLPGSPAEALS